MGLPRLERQYLRWCTELVEIHPSIGQLRRLVVLDMERCSSLFNFPSITTEMESLNLCCCSKIWKIPEFKGIMKSLSVLNLKDTAIEKLPFSIECFDCPYYTNLKYCRELEFIPSNMDSLRSLEKLILSNCSKLSYLPENFWKIKCLKEPKLSMMSGLEGIWLNGIVCLSSLKHLTIIRNSFVTLPTSIGQLSKLEAPDLSVCKNLRSLQELPSAVRYINAQECYSLQSSLALQVIASLSRIVNQIVHYGVSCVFWVQELLCRKIGCETSPKRKEDGSGTAFQIIIYGTEIPRWITHQSFGKSVRIELPPNW